MKLSTLSCNQSGKLLVWSAVDFLAVVAALKLVNLSNDGSLIGFSIEQFVPRMLAMSSQLLARCIFRY